MSSENTVKDPENLENIKSFKYKKHIFMAIALLTILTLGFVSYHFIFNKADKSLNSSVSAVTNPKNPSSPGTKPNSKGTEPPVKPAAPADPKPVNPAAPVDPKPVAPSGPSGPEIIKFQVKKSDSSLEVSAGEDILSKLEDIPMPPLKEFKTTKKSIDRIDENISHAVQMLFRSSAVRKIMANSDVFINSCEERLEEVKKDPKYLQQKKDLDEKRFPCGGPSETELAEDVEFLNYTLTVARGLNSCFSLLQSLPNGSVDLDFDENTKAFRDSLKNRDPENAISQIYSSLSTLISDKKLRGFYAHYADEGNVHEIYEDTGRNETYERHEPGFKFRLRDYEERKLTDLVHSFFTKIHKEFYYRRYPVEHFKTSKLISLPPTISINLDQFSYKKELISDPVEVAHEIDFAPYFYKDSLDKFGKNTTYKLKRFITRDGTTQEDSIYTSYIQDVDGTWYKIKEGNVEKIQMDDSITSKGYYFVYEKIKE